MHSRKYVSRVFRIFFEKYFLTLFASIGASRAARLTRAPCVGIVAFVSCAPRLNAGAAIEPAAFAHRNKDGSMHHEATYLTGEDALFEFLGNKLRDIVKPHDRLAIKLHMGEPGNEYFIPPALARRLVECLTMLGCDPFVFDSPVIYTSPRSTAEGYLAVAAEHGYTRERIGAPIVISNRSVPVRGMRMTYHAAADPIDADGVLLLTHVKGHVACGMGGAIKNVGMGCVAKETKGAIHAGGEPVYREGCTQCGECVSNCPTGNITLEPEGPSFGATWCPGCSNCALVCPAHCITPRVGAFDELLAESAVLAHAKFRKRFAVNVLKNISKHCDCMPAAGPLIAPDIGFICADDMLTADIASLETIAAVSGRADLFADYHKHSPWEHVRAAARLMDRDTTVAIKAIG